MSTLIKLSLALFVLWAAGVTLFTAMQGAILFPRSMVGPAPTLPQSARRLTLPRPDGVELHGVLIPGRTAGRPVILGFAGNAWNAESMALFLHGTLPEYTVVAFHYRGYAPSTGSPSATGLMADAESIHDFLNAEGMPDQIAIGFSIGSGLAAHLASVRGLQGAVLVTPFDTLQAVARQTLPWAPVRWLFRHDMDALGALQSSAAPVGLILATRDEVIPPARSEALVAGLEHGAPPPAYLKRIPAGHNDIYAHPDFAPALRAAIDAVQD